MIKKAYVRTVIIIKDLKNSRDLKDWEMLKMNGNKKRESIYSDIKKTQKLKKSE